MDTGHTARETASRADEFERTSHLDYSTRGEAMNEAMNEASVAHVAVTCKISGRTAWQRGAFLVDFEGLDGSVFTRSLDH